jgi:DNA-binding response OmpR family regulator
MKGDCGAYLSAGMDAYVAKPMRGRELYAALARFSQPASPSSSSSSSKPSLQKLRLAPRAG